MEWNRGVAPVAAPFTDGCWYDPADGVYRLYYHAGWFDGTALAVSADGRHFTRKMLDNQVGTNRIFVPKPGWQRDGSCVWLDQETEHPEERYKMFHYFRTPEGDVAQVAVSADGMHFGDPVTTGLCGDNTSFFYNPFRRKWVFSIRTGLPSTPWYSRGRSYYECDRLMEGASWANDQIAFWQRCDVRDLRESEPGKKKKKICRQLYHPELRGLWESVVLRPVCHHQRDSIRRIACVCESSSVPKHIDLHAGFSRDGFHFSRDNQGEPVYPLHGSAGLMGAATLYTTAGCALSRRRAAPRLRDSAARLQRKTEICNTRRGDRLCAASPGRFRVAHANGTRQFMLTRKMLSPRGGCCSSILNAGGLCPRAD